MALTPEGRHALKVALFDAEQEAQLVAHNLLSSRKTVQKHNALLRDALERVSALRGDLKIGMSKALASAPIIGAGDEPVHIAELQALLVPDTREDDDDGEAQEK